VSGNENNNFDKCFLGDFGGTMGLWLGASVLAAIQLIDYLFTSCSVKCARRRKARITGKGADNSGYNA